VNRRILQYGTPLTAVILLVFAWVVYRRLAGGLDAIIPLAAAAVIVWLPGTFVLTYLWPRITVGGFKRALDRGFGGGPIPVNTLYAVEASPSASASSGNLMAVGTDDVLYVVGWIDLKAGARVLHVPEMAGRYYCVQLTDPTSGTNFAYVGKRSTGTGPGAFLLCEPGWHGDAPDGMTKIDLPHRSALVIGRVFVADERDRPVAYALAKQIRLAPLG
jgi:hypothetical protein